jgi:hypothetical protein
MPNESSSFEETPPAPSRYSPPSATGVAAQRSKLEMAQDCQTDADWLARASHWADTNVLKAVARNPNTPDKVLLKLWEKFPETILENPVITLWEFSSSKPIAERIPKKVLFFLIKTF